MTTKLKLSGNMKEIPMRDEIQAMTVICNIQAMQTVIYGKAFAYSDFAGNTLDELHNLQDSLIPEYNKAISK